MKDRRGALSWIFWSGVYCLASACGTRNTLSTGSSIAARKVKDIKTNSPISVILKAEDIVARIPLTLYYDEGGHRHPYLITESDFSKLIRGEVVRIQSDLVQGHRHTVILDPSRNPPNASELDVPEESEGVIRNRDLYLALNSEKSPRIYLKSSHVIDNARYCQGSEDVCNRNSLLWHPLRAEDAGARALVSTDVVLFDSNGGDLQVLAQTPTGDRLWTTFRIKAK